ncbi:TerB N-terminal domain-containing protein [Sporosarcina cyprini]|uniref:TerB N-terminal domain-containing protein n=1 Tax=Sporosarcina cyprini TaxID=2910523 RepID=UPI001EE11B3A|nr:TerB N-terminal domain-containing protein [Sporosarcina cyprini]MCG3086356.1 TerB N-terminal domain-containing protein [Sporosarcina cyprini]
MNTKSKTIGYLLAIFLGGLGIHAFYYKRYMRGILYLVFYWTYIPIFLGWIDIFFIKKWHELLSNREGANKIKNVVEAEQRQEKKKETKRVKESIPQKSVLKNNLSFYIEDNIILPEYKHIQTPKDILESINEIRNLKKKTHSENGVFMELTFSHSNFVKDSLLFAKEKGQECPEIPLHAYWTTFDQLNTKQRKWYFYWREQVLNGHYPDVDLSYIILFIYELMNYSFNQNAAFNISMMVRLHEEYKKRVPKLINYSERWIADMLYEVKEQELAKEWISERKQVPPLYQQMLNKENDLSKISITSWKPYVKNYRETVFFTKNKNKIYKVFKDSILLLKQIYEKEDIQLIDRWFQSKEEREIRHLFGSAVIDRNYDPIHVYTERVKPTEDLFNEVTALFKLSENVTRLMNGEKREVKVEKEYLPEGLKDMMMELFTKKAKDANKRFKVVQQSEAVEQGGEIPSPPPEERQEEPKKFQIEFDKEKISKLQSDTEGLIQIINSRSEAEHEADNEPSNEENPVTEKEEVEKTDSNQKILENQSSQVDVFSVLAGTDGDVEGEEEFLEVLSDIEKDFLLQFVDGQFSQEEAYQFVKKQGIMLGMFLSELNEKASEYLGDNLLENQEDTIVIYEEYENVLISIKEYA